MSKILEIYKETMDTENVQPVAVTFFFLWFASVQIPLLTYYGYLLYRIFFDQMPGDPSSLKMFSFTLFLCSPYIFVIVGFGQIGVGLWALVGILSCMFGLSMVVNT
jgi:hypothetical protein